MNLVFILEIHSLNTRVVLSSISVGELNRQTDWIDAPPDVCRDRGCCFVFEMIDDRSVRNSGSIPSRGPWDIAMDGHGSGL